MCSRVPEWLNDFGVAAGVLIWRELMPGTVLVMSLIAKIPFNPGMERGEQVNLG
jgi:hypothetical protein